MKKLLLAGSAALGLCLWCSPAPADALDDARKLLGERKFEEVDKALERELAVTNPRPEALQLSLNAALGAGRYLTAERRVAALLKATQSKDLELLYTGAVIAERTGDFRAALSRYLEYAKLSEDKGPKTEKALRYILSQGIYPAEYKKYVRLFGATERSWALGATLMDRLFAIPDADKGLDIAAFLIEQFPAAPYVNHVHWRLRTAADNFELGRDPKPRYVAPLKIMVRGAPSDLQHVAFIFQNAYASLSDEERVDTVFALQAKTKAPLGGWFMDVFFAMRELPKNDAKLKWGKEYLAAEPLYAQSKNRDEHVAYLRVIAEAPQVFNLKDAALVSPADVQAKFDALKARFADNPRVLGGMANYIQNYYLSVDPAVRNAFLRKHLDTLSFDQVTEYLRLTNYENFDAVLAEYGKGQGFKGTLDVKLQAIGLYNQFADNAVRADAAAQDALAKAKAALDKANAEAKDQVPAAQEAFNKAQAEAAKTAPALAAVRAKYAPVMLQITRDHLSGAPGSFNWQHVRAHVINSALIDAAAKLALLQEVITKGGAGEPMRALLNDMANDKAAWGDNPKFQELRQLLESKPAGTDALMRAHVAACGTKGDQAVHDFCKGFLAEFKGAVPGGWEKTQNVQDMLVFGIFERHLQQMWNNAGGIYALGELWAPRLGLGSGWNVLTQRIAEHNGWNALYKMAPAYVALCKGNETGDPAVWWTLARCTHPKNDTTPVFADAYGKMGTNAAASYLFNQRDAWSEKPAFILGELEKIINAPNAKLTSRPIVSQLIAHLFHYWARPESKPSAKLVTTLWDALLASEETDKSYDVNTEALVYGIYARAGMGKEAADFFNAYQALIKKRTPLEQIAALTAVFAQVNLPVEPQPGQLTPGMRWHTILKVVGPLYAQIPAPAWRLVTITANIHNEVDAMIRNWPAGDAKTDALAMGQQIVNMFIEGAPFDGHQPWSFNIVDFLCRQAIRDANWDEASRLCTFYATIMNREPNWDDTYQNRILPIVKLLEEKGASEIIYPFIATIEKRNTPPEKVAKQLAVVKSRAGSGIAYLIPVEKSDPTYDLYAAAQALSLGNEEKAWELTSPKLKLLAKEYLKLDPDYVGWCVDQMRKQKLLQEALDFSFTLLLNEADFDPEIASKISLTKGDIYRDMGNYQAARIEYEGLKNNARYNRTPAGAKATYRLIDLLILTKDYSAATGILERLADSDNIETQAEAYYYYAKMAYQEGQYKEAKEYLKRVRERVLNHVEAAFLEGELNLLLPGGLQYTEVAVGNPRLALFVIPGRVLTLKLQDQNLSIARGGAAIPVVITTSKGLDEEHVKLLPSSTNKNLFIGQIATALGKVEKNNTRLEVRGDDVVSYVIEPEFQKANELDYPPKLLEVVANGRLVASSGEILTEEEEEKRALERQIQRTRESETRRFDEVRDNRTVRPGSRIYVQVTDFDRDLSDEADKIVVDLRTSSGDILEGFALTETEPHSGMFRGAVPTGIPLPKAMTSDGPDAGDPSGFISAVKNEPWTSLGDGKKPKWVEVDTMTSQLLKGASLEVGSAATLKQVRLFGMLADDLEELAAYPERSEGADGGLLVELAMDQRGEHPDAIRRYIKLNPSAPYRQEKAVFEREDTPMKGRDGWMTARMTGTFWLPESRSLELKFMQDPSPNGWQHAYVFIDGEYVLGGPISPQVMKIARKVDLVKGAHKLEILVRDYWSRSKVRLGHVQDDGTVAEIPGSWFATQDNPDLAEFLRPKGKISIEGNTFAAALDKPTRLRKLRWVIEDYEGNSFVVKKLTAADADGKGVVPVKEDFTAGMKNQTLEISPGDQVQVVYRDEKRLREDTPVLDATLNASFFNGEIMLTNEVVHVNQRNEKSFEYVPAKRCRPGDTLMVVVTDYDYDLTANRDTVPLVARTSSGETLPLKALEDAPNWQDERKQHSGVFYALLKIGNETKGDTIKVLPGDKVTVSYVDSENTVPGIPVERTYAINEAGSSKPAFVVYETNVKQVPDTSDEAKAKLKRMRTGDTENAVIYKDLVVARHPDFDAVAAPAPAEGEPPAAAPPGPAEAVCSVNAPLLFELSYPKMALNAGSVLTIEALADSEVAAAAKENRQPTVLKVPLHVESIERLADIKGYPIQLQSHMRRNQEDMLRDGTFAGVVRLQIGSPGDPIDDLVVRGEKQFAATERETDQEGFQYRVATMIVAGSDIVTLTVKDEANNPLVQQKVRLLSDGRMEVVDATYTVQKGAIHLGEKLYVKITDPDQDTTSEIDTVKVKVASASGDQVTLSLTETLAHSGVFTGSFKPEFIGEKTAEKAPVANATDDVLSVSFGDEIVLRYTDTLAISAQPPVEIEQKATVHHGSDAEVACFSKRFKDPEMAVKTRFLMAEALFEMAKEHRKLKQTELASEEIATGKRILEEAMRDYPDTNLAAQGEFLLANLAQELDNFQEAIGRYSHVISTWPESEYASRSQFKKAICLERMGNYDLACEEYVKVTYIYPESPLVADATVRLGNYYYKKEAYKVAAQIFHKFQQRNSTHALASKALFLAAQCWYKMKDYTQAVKLFANLVDEYTDDKEVREEAMYWLGDSYFNKRDYVKAYQTFKKLTWDYPEGRWAKIARGRLTDEAFARIEDE